MDGLLNQLDEGAVAPGMPCRSNHGWHKFQWQMR